MSTLSPIARDASIDSVIEVLRAKFGESGHICLDSRQIQAGDIFVACPGRAEDGKKFIDDAISRGAAGVLVAIEDNQVLDVDKLPAACILMTGLSARLGELANAWYGRPSEALKVIAITGTNGKTSCAQWLAQALNSLGRPAGVIGTLGLTFPDGVTLEGQLTTPDALTIHRLLARLQQSGARFAVIEASSIGLTQSRLDCVRIELAAFTNLSHDHLDYHGSMAEYEAAKRLLFEHPGLNRAVLNLDDRVGAKWAKTMPVPKSGFSIQADRQAEVAARRISYEADHTRFTLVTADGAVPVASRALGAHNVSNFLCVAASLLALGFKLDRVRDALENLRPVPGRLQKVESIFSGIPTPLVVVDYAHTPDALERTLASLAPLARARGGIVWCVFGCGGDRDAQKRPLMAAVASRGATRCVVTSDNPRNESAQTIIDQIVSGFPADARILRVQPNRAQAILSTILDAAEQDVVLLAGKGHETYQETAGKKEFFDDRQWAQAAFLLLSQSQIQTDSRKLVPGEIFLALKGDRFDGHDYLNPVRESGAKAAIVEFENAEVSAAGLTQIALGDTRAALMQLGQAWRRRFNIPVIAVTGSNGKTTTKEMIAAMLARWVGEENRLATQGNLNNELGVPLTLLRLRSRHRAAVIELGMNHPGEIVLLARATSPTVALVNNAQREHQEFMESIAAVARENGEVFQFLCKDGVAVFPADDEYTNLWREMSATMRHITFGLDKVAEVCAQDIELSAVGSRFVLSTPGQAQLVDLPVPGLHNIRNALAATACCVSAGVPVRPIYDALLSFSAVKGRMQSHRLAQGVTLIDDTYNANPDSVRAAIDVLAALTGPTVLVLGDMGEVGDNGPEMHREIGRYAKERGVDHLVTLGMATRDSAQAFGEAAVVCETIDQVLAALEQLRPQSLLVKGSRFMRMERIVAAVLERVAGAPVCVTKETSHAV